MLYPVGIGQSPNLAHANHADPGAPQAAQASVPITHWLQSDTTIAPHANVGGGASAPESGGVRQPSIVGQHDVPLQPPPHSQPSVALPLQSAQPVLHAYVHAPFAHEASVFSLPTVQSTVHVP